MEQPVRLVDAFEELSAGLLEPIDLEPEPVVEVPPTAPDMPAEIEPAPAPPSYPAHPIPELRSYAASAPDGRVELQPIEPVVPAPPAPLMPQPEPTPVIEGPIEKAEVDVTFEPIATISGVSSLMKAVLAIDGVRSHRLRKVADGQLVIRVTYEGGSLEQSLSQALAEHSAKISRQGASVSVHLN
jgi:hypothetical protein